MKTWKTLASLRAVSVALITAVFIAGCGGSSSSAPEPVAEISDTGTVGLWFTDLPTDDFDSIILTVSEASLIGGDGERQVLFTGKREIDLLNLTNYSEPVVFGEVKAGNYSKIRLMIDEIELVHFCPEDNPDCDPESDFVDKLPANGKVDLLQPDGFDILPGRTVTIEIDVDANKAIHVVGAGKSGKYKFRPVVKVNVYDGGMPHKLARLEGAVSGEPDVTNDTFVLCSIDAPDHCVDVSTDLTPETGTSFFDDQGLKSDFTGLADGVMVVVIGEYSINPYVLKAVVVEIGGNAEQVTGNVGTEPSAVTEPDEKSRFLVLTVGGESLIVELQVETKYYDEDGPINSSAVVLGARVEVEGVRPTTGLTDDPDFRAALVFLEGPEGELVRGTVAAGTQNSDTKSFELVPESDGATPFNVCLIDDPVIERPLILLVNTTAMTVEPGYFEDIVDDAVIDVFGRVPEGESCFSANEVIVDVTPAP